MIDELESTLIKKAIKFKADWLDTQNRGMLNYEKYEDECADITNDAAYLDSVLRDMEASGPGNVFAMFESVLFYIQAVKFILSNIELVNEVKKTYEKELQSLEPILKKLESLTDVKPST